MASWKDVTDANIYKLGSEVALQYVWKGIPAMSAMNDKCQLDLFRWPSYKWLQTSWCIVGSSTVRQSVVVGGG